MAVKFLNFDHSYLRDGKPVYKPSELGKRIGYDIKSQVEEIFELDDFAYHFAPGGHVAALHLHRRRKFFARVDIERFFYGIGRNRVGKALQSLGIARSEHYARWSTVKNPYRTPGYALPYGFVQSPILATLVLLNSSVGRYLRELPEDITRSVYMDDIALSGDDIAALSEAFDGLVRMLGDSGFAINQAKTRPPSEAIDLFKCDLELGRTAVRQDRRDEFNLIDRSERSRSAFERYCASVEAGND